MTPPLLLYAKVYIHLQLLDTKTNTHLKLELPGTVLHTIQEDGPQGESGIGVGMQIFLMNIRSEELQNMYLDSRQNH